MEVRVMKIISRRMPLGRETNNIVTRSTERYRVQPASEVLDPGKQSVPHPYDQFRDLESARLMEERYGIKEEGLF
jgi:hypothetical protein